MVKEFQTEVLITVQNETTDVVIPFTDSPNNEDIPKELQHTDYDLRMGCVSDPHFVSIKNVSTIHLVCCCLHPCRI